MPQNSNEILEFKNVSFGYSDEKMILKDVNLKFYQGKTYALVGPTGGGKSTTAGLMVRLYDPQSGVVEFRNKDIRSYKPSELSSGIGFILQEPFLFTGTVAQNIAYGNPDFEEISPEELEMFLHSMGLEKLLERFENGLKTEVSDNSENISLGQKQLVAFMRILLRKPELLIMDEATANIDTVTEQYLNEIISKLPKETTKVVIAHRLNTIREADEIIFINGGKVKPSMTFDEALHLIDSSKRSS
jgi:ATP-binding cassette subfamily B protein